MTNDLERASALIVDLHRFFTDWMSGACAKRAESLTTGLLQHVAPDFVGIMASGVVITPVALEQWMSTVHGASPQFRIAIRNVTIRRRLGAALVVTYEEWAHDAPEPRPNNARLSTMVLRDHDGRLQVAHLQETWLPEEVVRSGDFNF